MKPSLKWWSLKGFHVGLNSFFKAIEKVHGLKQKQVSLYLYYHLTSLWLTDLAIWVSTNNHVLHIIYNAP